MTQQIANYVQTTLASSITNAATTATLTSVAGLPTTGVFRLVLKDPNPATTFEITEVASVNIGTGVVTFSGGAGVGRGLEGTSAIAHNAGTLVGNDITAAMLLAAFPWGMLPNGYAQIVASQTGITTAVDVTGLAVTVTVGAGRRIRISCYAEINASVSTDNDSIAINEGATVLQLATVPVVASSSGGAARAIVSASVVIQPSAGSHTYKLQAYRSNGTGTMSIIASATQPAYILVEDIGSN